MQKELCLGLERRARWSGSGVRNLQEGPQYQSVPSRMKPSPQGTNTKSTGEAREIINQCRSKSQSLEQSVLQQWIPARVCYLPGEFLCLFSPFLNYFTGQQFLQQGRYGK